jgi:Cu/Ag efflux pump CusA
LPDLLGRLTYSDNGLMLDLRGLARELSMRTEGTGLAPPALTVIEAAMSRFRPIMLTAISTVLGMIPIAPTIFWGPMAYAIMGGLLVATVLTLIFLPVLYIAWFRVSEPAAAARAT